MKKIFVIGLSLAAVTLLFSTSAMAQLSSQKTIFTINAPMRIPGDPAVVLPPGKYVMKLLDSATTRTVVRFFNAGETKLYTTVIGIPDYTIETPGKAEIRFYETQSGHPRPIRDWFYPGGNYGVEFVQAKAQPLHVANQSTGKALNSQQLFAAVSFVRHGVCAR